MAVKVILVDINPKMIKAWRATFEENPEVQIEQGSMLAQTTSAWVSPTNGRGSMDGGLDLAIKNHLGAGIEKKVQDQIRRFYGGTMPIGRATCVETDKTTPRFLISTPTMTSSNENVSDTLNVALACSAAFQAVRMQNRLESGSITSIALPGLGANTGRVPPEICADLMWTAYSLFINHDFESYDQMRNALEAELGNLAPSKSSKIIAVPYSPPSFSNPNVPASKPASVATPGPTKTIDMDFDDSE